MSIGTRGSASSRLFSYASVRAPRNIQAPCTTICELCELRRIMATDHSDLEAQFPGPSGVTVKAKAEVVEASIKTAKLAAEAKHQHLGEKEFQDRLGQAIVKYNEVCIACSWT